MEVTRNESHHLYSSYVKPPATTIETSPVSMTNYNQGIHVKCERDFFDLHDVLET